MYYPNDISLKQLKLKIARGFEMLKDKINYKKLII